MAEQEKKQSFFGELFHLLKTNLRDYMMYIVLVAIIIYFSSQTNGGFVKALNISNLINQSGYVAMLAIGMTLILILVQIDLSVGFVAGFSGAIASILLSKQLNVWLVIFIVLLVGLAIGMYQGLIVTRVGVPAFVTTLAGMFIFRGLLSLSLQGTGTIIISDPTFNALSNGFIPDIGSNEKFHLLTAIIGIVAIILVAYFRVRARKQKQKYNFKVSSAPLFIFGLIFVSAIIMVIIMLLANYKGIPWTAVIVGIVLLIYNFMLNKTKLGRYIYGIGGNAQASELSGVNVKAVKLFAFCSMGVLAALGGILYTSRLQSASPAAGVGFELDAIASAYIGGVAVTGGIGKVTNTIIGTLVIMSLTNGMNLMGIDIAYQYVVKGAIFIIAVAFDVRSRKKAK
jgi:putative multiple sugar transport system permease protein